MKIRKFTVLILAFLMLLSNVGFAFSVHYCGENIDSINVFKSAREITLESCCSISGVRDKKCCSEKVIRIKDHTDQVTKKTIFPKIAEFLYFNGYDFIPVVSSEFFEICSYRITYLVERCNPTLFKLYSQYIFYA